MQINKKIMGEKFDCDKCEHALRKLNILLPVLILVVGMILCQVPPTSVIASTFAYFFLPVNALMALRRRGIFCQVILLTTTIVFILYCLYWRQGYVNALYVNLDAQSGLVHLLGFVYSILMLPFWFLAFLFSTRRYAPNENESAEPETSAISNGKDNRT